MPKPNRPSRAAINATLHPPLHFTPLGDTAPFTPSVQRPVRIRARTLPADSHFEPHHHAWAQLAYCATGIVQVTAEQHATGGEQVREAEIVNMPFLGALAGCSARRSERRVASHTSEEQRRNAPGSAAKMGYWLFLPP